MRVLFFMSHAGQARNFEWTLRGLAERGHQVHMAFDKMEKRNLPGMADLANSLVAEYPGITSGEQPQPPKADWSWVSSRMRASLDFMRYLESEFEDAPKLRRRAERFPPPQVARLVTAAPPFTRTLVRGALRRADQAAPVAEIVDSYIREQQPDAVLVTPLLEPGSLQVEYLRAAKRLNVPTCLCVASWDNLTNKGLIHELPDAVTVWNEMQLQEAVQLHDVPPDRVVVTGAAPYDHWFGWEPSCSRGDFAKRVGLDPSRPFLLYVGSSGFIAPDEAGFIVEWIRGLGREGLADVQVLARPHPVNPLVGNSPSQVELGSIDNVRLYPPAGQNPTDAESRQNYFDSMYFCSAVAGVNTSAFLEAAVLGRPVFTVLGSRYKETQEGMLHFHHLLNAGGGLLHVARTYEEHAAALREALRAPHPEGCVSERSLRFTQAFIRPYGLDTPGTPRLLETIEGLPDRRNGANPSGYRKSLTGAAMVRTARTLVKHRRRRNRRAKHKRDRIGRPKEAKRKDPKAAKARKAAKRTNKGKPREAGSAPIADGPPVENQSSETVKGSSAEDGTQASHAGEPGSSP